MRVLIRWFDPEGKNIHSILFGEDAFDLSDWVEGGLVDLGDPTTPDSATASISHRILKIASEEYEGEEVQLIEVRKVAN